MVPYSGTTSEDLFFGEEDVVLYLRTVLRWNQVCESHSLFPFCCLLLLPSLSFPSSVPTPQWAHQPGLRNMCRSRKISYKKQLFGAPPPPCRILRHCEMEEVLFLFFVEVVPVLQELTI